MPWEPDLFVVFGANLYTMFRTSAMPDTESAFFHYAASRTDAIVCFDANGVWMGSYASVVTAGKRFHWMAMRADVT